MKADFHLQRELKNKFEHKRVHSPSFYVHFHSHIEIYVVHSGEIEIIVNDQKRVLRSGELSIAFSYDSHGYRTVATSEAEYLIIPLSYCKDMLPLLEHKKTASPFIDDPETYALVSDAMRRLSQNPNELSKQGWIYVILGAILDKVQLSQAEKLPISRFSPEILIYISQHCQEALTLPMLAKHFGYNPSYLSRSFKENFGISFSKYLTILRLREAILRIQDGESSITKCALESGFGSMRSFYRAFREEFGVSPKEYFEQNNENISTNK